MRSKTAVISRCLCWQSRRRSTDSHRAAENATCCTGARANCNVETTTLTPSQSASLGLRSTARLTTGPKTFPAAFYFRIIYPPGAVAIANLIFSPFLLHHPALALPLSPSSPHPRASGPSLTFR